MSRTLFFTALFATSSLFFSQLSLAEESPAFVARSEAMQHRAQSAQDEAVATRKAAEQVSQDS